MKYRSRSDIIITASIVVGVVGIVLALAGLILGGFGSSGDKEQVIEQALSLPDPRATVAEPALGDPASVRVEPLSSAGGQRPSTESSQAATEQALDESSQPPTMAATKQLSETGAESEQALEYGTLHPGGSEPKASEPHSGPTEGVAQASKHEQRIPAQNVRAPATSKQEPVTQKTRESTSKGEKIAPTTASRSKLLTQVGLRSTAWLLKQDSNHYTIQILAVRRLQALKEYTVAQSIPLDLAYFRTRRDGRDYYVLVAGVFPTREAARVAASKLPKKVRANTPWIRKIEAVQRAIQ